MPIYTPTGFLDITNATLRTSNLEAENFKLNGGNIYVTTDFTTPPTLQLIADFGNVTSNTIQFSNDTTGLVTTANVSVGKDLTVAGDINFSGTFNQNGAPFPPSPWITTGVDISYTTGNVSVGKDLTVTGNALVSSNLTVAGNALVSDDLTVTGNALVSSNLTVTGNVSVSDDLTVTGNALVSSNLTVAGNVSVSDDLTVTGGVTSTTSLMSNVVTIGTTKTFVVKVGSNGKYEINGVDRPTLHLHQHQTYIFDLSSSTLSGHPFIFSETASGSSYDTGITTTGAYGSTEKRTFVVPAGAPTTLYYYCTSYSGMGATASISSTAELMVSGRVESTDLVVTGTSGISIGSGTTAQRPANPTLGTIRYNSTTGFMEGYAAAGWAPIAQPPTITGLSPLTTLTSGGVVAGWSQEHKFVSPDAVFNDLMGADAKNMSMSADGTKYIVGVPTSGTGGRGAAYIFTYSGGSWDTGTKLQAPSPVNGDEFGYSVSMNSDGTKVIVGTRGHYTSYTKQGAAYIFTYSSGSWGSGTKILASDAATGNQFGTSVTMSGDGTKVVVGAFSISNWDIIGFGYYFTWNGSIWTQQQKITTTTPALVVNDYFFWDCNMNTAGTKMIVGAFGYDLPSESETGAAFIFTFNGSSWSQEAYLAPPTSDRQGGDQFGRIVAMSGDGNTVIVSMNNDDLGGNNKPNAGAAYIFTYSSGSWDTGTKIVAADAETNNDFGRSVAINSDGTTVVVGSPDHVYSGPRYGTAYRFTYDGSIWDTGTRIDALDAQGSDEFGASVAMNSDGTKILVGARREDDGATDAGAVYLFSYRVTELFDASTQVFTATGTGIVSGSTVQLEGADGSLYSVVDATPPNAAGTQVTFKMKVGGGSTGTVYPDIDMTSASQGGYVVTAHTEGSSSEAMWKAFDGDSSSTFWKVDNGYSTSSRLAVAISGVLPSFTDTAGTAHAGHWIQLELPKKIKLTRFVTAANFASSYFMKSYVVLGSNDNTSWTLLHSEANGTGVQDVTTLSGGSTSFFKYFKLLVKSKLNGGNAHLQVGEVEFYGILDDGRFDVAQQPYKVKVNSTSGLIGTSTAAIGFAVGWTTAADADLDFDIAASTTRTLAGTDGGGGTNRTFSISPLSAVQALPAKVGGGTLVLTGSTGDIIGQIAADQDGVTTTVTFRLTDIGSGLFTDRDINIKGSSELYTMAFPFTFNTAGVVGSTGPTRTQLMSTYSPDWTDYTSNLNVTAGIQEWTVPITGSYQIEAYGARGGTHGSATVSNNRHGKGAKMQGTFTLTRGEILKIAVGQLPTDVGTATEDSGYGGGGTGVIKSPYNTDASILVIAGGGGGAGYASANSTAAGHGLTTNEGGYNFSEHADSSGNGGKHTHTTGDCGWGAGGGGFHTNGWSSNSSNATGGNYTQLTSNAGSGKSFINGGGGGVSGGCSQTTTGIQGGFGCGGGGSGMYGGAGGGGYSGGSGSHYTGSGAGGVYGVSGGGGGSYNSGSSQSNSSGVNNDAGYVVITKL